MSENMDFLDEIFDIPVDGGNIDDGDDVQDNAFTEVGKGVYNIKYEDKANEIKNAISSSDEPFEFVDAVEGGTSSDQSASEKNISSPPTISQKNSTEQNNAEVVSEPPFHHDAVKSSSNDENEDDVRSESDSIVITEKAPIEDDPDWLLTCGSVKLQSFYEHKISKIKRLKKIGIIPFDKYQEELKQAFVPIWNPSDDTSVVNEKIKAIADWRNRVTQILLEVDPQLAWWDMVIEHMQGLLAMAQYEKPKERQNGMHYLHLRDMEYYLAKLKGLKANCSSVMSNLDKAYDSLSRQITVIMPQKEIERYSPQPIAKSQEAYIKEQKSSISPNRETDSKKDEDVLSEFDVLPTHNSNVKKASVVKNNPIPSKGVKIVSWGDIGKK